MPDRNPDASSLPLCASGGAAGGRRDEGDRDRSADTGEKPDGDARAEPVAHRPRNTNSPGHKSCKDGPGAGNEHNQTDENCHKSRNPGQDHWTGIAFRVTLSHGSRSRSFRDCPGGPGASSLGLHSSWINPFYISLDEPRKSQKQRLEQPAMNTRYAPTRSGFSEPTTGMSMRLSFARTRSASKRRARTKRRVTPN